MWKITVVTKYFKKVASFHYCFYAMKWAEYAKAAFLGAKIYCKYEKE